ncbi:Rkm5p, partial [Saccharomyces cerevisiae YJM1443]
MAFKLWLLD